MVRRAADNDPPEFSLSEKITWDRINAEFARRVNILWPLADDLSPSLDYDEKCR
jgi:hypothetical protein